MDILIAYSFIILAVFMLTWGLLKIVEKLARIEYDIEHINKKIEKNEQVVNVEVRQTGEKV